MFVTDWQIVEKPLKAADKHKDYGIGWESEIFDEIRTVSDARRDNIQECGRDRVSDHVQEAG